MAAGSGWSPNKGQGPPSDSPCLRTIEARQSRTGKKLKKFTACGSTVRRTGCYTSAGRRYRPRGTGSCRSSYHTSAHSRSRSCSQECPDSSFHRSCRDYTCMDYRSILNSCKGYRNIPNPDSNCCCCRQPSSNRHHRHQIASAGRRPAPSG